MISFHFVHKLFIYEEKWHFPKKQCLTPLIKEDPPLSVHTAWRLAGSLMRGLWFIVHITVVLSLSLSQTHVRQAQVQNLDFCLAQVSVIFPSNLYYRLLCVLAGWFCLLLCVGRGQGNQLLIQQSPSNTSCDLHFQKTRHKKQLWHINKLFVLCYLSFLPTLLQFCWHEHFPQQFSALAPHHGWEIFYNYNLMHPKMNNGGSRPLSHSQELHLALLWWTTLCMWHVIHLHKSIRTLRCCEIIPVVSQLWRSAKLREVVESGMKFFYFLILKKFTLWMDHSCGYTHCAAIHPWHCSDCGWIVVVAVIVVEILVLSSD